MIEKELTLLGNGSAKIAGGSSALLFGYTKNRGIYRLHVNAAGEWVGLTIRALWHIPDGRCFSSLVGEDGVLDVPPLITARSGAGCITFEGSDGTCTVTSADVRYHVAGNSGTNDPSMPEPGTPAWQEFLNLLGCQNGSSLGLSVVDGKLCITYEEVKHA